MDKGHLPLRRHCGFKAICQLNDGGQLARARILPLAPPPPELSRAYGEWLARSARLVTKSTAWIRTRVDAARGRDAYATLAPAV
jgi:hypothetical protein